MFNGKKITLATVKKFIRDNAGKLYISTGSTFDGMVDCVMPCADKGFTLAQTPDEGQNHSNKLGVQGAWFVFGSRDSFSAFEADGFTGIKVYNCCGSFRLAVRA
jgi:hypothetical protein